MRNLKNSCYKRKRYGDGETLTLKLVRIRSLSSSRHTNISLSLSHSWSPPAHDKHTSIWQINIIKFQMKLTIFSREIKNILSNDSKKKKHAKIEKVSVNDEFDNREILYAHWPFDLRESEKTLIQISHSLPLPRTFARFLTRLYGYKAL